MNTSIPPVSGYNTAVVRVKPFEQDMAEILTGQLSESSIKMYQRDINAYQAYADTNGYDPLDSMTLLFWRDELSKNTTMSPNTINRMMSAVKRIVKEASRRKQISPAIFASFNEIEGLKIKPLKKRLKKYGRVLITSEDMRRLCETPDGSTRLGIRDRAILATLASSGGRASEIASLTQEQIVKKGEEYFLLLCGKTDIEYREALLSQEAHTLIQLWLQAKPDTKNPYIFIGDRWRGNKYQPIPQPREDDHITEEAIWQLVQKYAKQCGLEHIKPHDFRRFLGTKLAAKDIRKAQLALGHKSIEVTARAYVLDKLEGGLSNHLY